MVFTVKMLLGVVLIKLGLNIWSWSFCVTAYQRGLEEVRSVVQMFISAGGSLATFSRAGHELGTAGTGRAGGG